MTDEQWILTLYHRYVELFGVPDSPANAENPSAPLPVTKE